MRKSWSLSSLFDDYSAWNVENGDGVHRRLFASCGFLGTLSRGELLSDIPVMQALGVSVLIATTNLVGDL